MNREIKFRAWDEVNKEMVYPIKPDINISGRASWWILKNYEHVMQFTGLKDKMEREIFEGDIVKWVNTDHEEFFIGPVEWTINQSHWQTGMSLTSVSPEDLWLPDVYEIVGNIYENPELVPSTKFSQC